MISGDFTEDFWSNVEHFRAFPGMIQGVLEAFQSESRGIRGLQRAFKDVSVDFRSFQDGF